MQRCIVDLYSSLQLVIDLSEHGSFSAVAHLRNQAPSSVSRKLDALEDHLGERLFNRTPNGVFLTDAGNRRLPEIQNLNSSAKAFMEKLPDDGRYHGSLSIAAPHVLGREYITPVIAEFLDDNPAVSATLHFTDSMQNLDRERIDLAIRVAAKNAEHHFIKKIGTNSRVLLASPDFIKRHALGGPGDLQDLGTIVIRDTNVWHLQHDRGEVIAIGIKPRIQCRSADSALRLCAAGMGVCLRSYFDAKPYLDSGELVHILPQWQEAGASQVISLVMPDRRLLSKTVAAFSELLTVRLKETLPK